MSQQWHDTVISQQWYDTVISQQWHDTVISQQWHDTVISQQWQLEILFGPHAPRILALCMCLSVCLSVCFYVSLYVASFRCTMSARVHSWPEWPLPLTTDHSPLTTDHWPARSCCQWLHHVDWHSLQTDSRIHRCTSTERLEIFFMLHQFVSGKHNSQQDF